MDRCWLLTWTTYGSWLPGDVRGSVTRVRSDRRAREPRTELSVPETPYVEFAPGLLESSSRRLKGSPVRLRREQATVVSRQFESTARHCGWSLLAGSVMANHVHLVVGVTDDPEPSKLLQIFKSYASRALNRQWNRPASDTWWTSSGSTRKLGDDAAVAAAVVYVQNQSHCLAQCAVVEVTRT